MRQPTKHRLRPQLTQPALLSPPMLPRRPLLKALPLPLKAKVAFRLLHQPQPQKQHQQPLPPTKQAN